jgi:membrane protein YdbS with pleckstrin-like domain
MIELSDKCPECGAVVKFGHTERHALCADCGHIWEPVLAPPVQSRTEPRVSIETARHSVDEDHVTLPSWLRNSKNEPVPHEKSYIESQLMPGERLIALTSISAAVVIAPFILTIVAALFFVTALVLRGEAAGVLGLFSAIGLIVFGAVTLTHAVERATKEFGLTDRRVIIKSGWIGTHVREMPLGKIEAIRVRQGIEGKLLGFGTIIVTGSGGTHRRMVNVEDPFGFYQLLQAEVARSH